MVACLATLQSQVLAVPMTACSLAVEHLKEKLLSAVENGQTTDVRDVLDELEKAPITKDILETTRVGAIVNDARKRISDQYPDIGKMCRKLIKNWQKLCEMNRPPSNASSASGTPNLVSPSMYKLARKVTPGANRRVMTPAGLSNGQQRGLTVSPSNGSYAPREHVSPTNAMHKSQSVGTELVAKGEENRNGKRKSDESTTPSLKRTKTVVGIANTVNTGGVVHSVSAARMAVQSTSELVAQLSQNLPEHMNIDSTLRQHEEKVKREQQDEELAISLHGALSTTIQPGERKKRKYERKIKPEMDIGRESPPPNGERRGGLILRLPRFHREDTTVKEDRPSTPIEPFYQSASQPTSRPESRPESRMEPKPQGKKINWLDMLPSMDELKKKVEERNANPPKPLDDPNKVYLLPVGQEEIVALPYLEDPSVPDFITYKYPDAAQFYAEEANRNV